MRSCNLPSGTAMPVLGLGTWRMGESARRRAEELDALKHGLDLGYPMIDTAEMYGEGGAEEIVGDALTGRATLPYIVSKVYPHNATRSGTIAACERSLKRMRIERIDLYIYCTGVAAPGSRKPSRRSIACATPARSLTSASAISIWTTWKTPQSSTKA
jgi:diketogulonate reductase-like aldo/keto reductase